MHEDLERGEDILFLLLIFLDEKHKSSTAILDLPLPDGTLFKRECYRAIVIPPQFLQHLIIHKLLHDRKHFKS